MPDTNGADTSGADAPSTGASIDNGLVDDELHAADGLRKTAQWIASGLGAIPGLAIVASIVRAPGDAGFAPIPLIVGILLAVAGALIGLWAFSNVMKPAALSEFALLDFKMDRLSGHSFDDYKALSDSIVRLRSSNAENEIKVADAEAGQEAAKAVAADAEERAKAAETLATETKPENPALKARAAAERKASDDARIAVQHAISNLSGAKAAVTVNAAQLKARQALRADVIRLSAADEVGKKFDTAWKFGILAATCVALGVAFLGLAPNPKAEEATALSLVTLTLNPDGRSAIGCDVPTLQAIRVGGRMTSRTS